MAAGTLLVPENGRLQLATRMQKKRLPPSRLGLQEPCVSRRVIDPQISGTDCVGPGSCLAGATAEKQEAVPTQKSQLDIALSVRSGQ
jgi:hypothetical protein